MNDHPEKPATFEEAAESDKPGDALYEQVIDLQRQVRRLRSLIIILFVGLAFIATGWTPLQMGPTSERSLVVYGGGNNSVMLEPNTGLRVFNADTNQMATLVTDDDGTRLMFLNIEGGPAHQIGIDAEGNFIQSTTELDTVDSDQPVPMLRPRMPRSSEQSAPASDD